MYSQLCTDTVWVLLLSLLLCIPAAHAAKCPQQCICDQIQLTVTCANKNLTQVPPTVDEVSYSNVEADMPLVLVRIHAKCCSFLVDNSEIRPSRQRHPGTALRGF